MKLGKVSFRGLLGWSRLVQGVMGYDVESGGSHLGFTLKKGEIGVE